MNEFDKVKLGIAQWQSALAESDPTEMLPVIVEFKEAISTAERENPRLSSDAILDIVYSNRALMQRMLQSAQCRLDDWFAGAVERLKETLSKLDANKTIDDVFSAMISDLQTQILSDVQTNQQLNEQQIFERIETQLRILTLVMAKKNEHQKQLLSRAKLRLKEAELKLTKTLLLCSTLFACAFFAGGMLIALLFTHKQPELLLNVPESVGLGVLYYFGSKYRITRKLKHLKNDL